MGAATRKAVKIAAKYKELNRLIDAGGSAGAAASKAKRAMVRVAYRYSADIPGAYHTNEKPNTGSAPLKVGANRSHLVTSL